MNELDIRTFRKVIGMFRPAENDFLDVSKEEIIQGPNDRGLIGFATYFPIEWLVEDFGFTLEEARHFVNLVHGKEGVSNEEA